MKLTENYFTNFSEKAFLTVGDYFQDGGEVYSRMELISKIENDLGLAEEDCNKLIRQCEESGFIIHIGGDIFTR